MTKNDQQWLKILDDDSDIAKDDDETDNDKSLPINLDTLVVVQKWPQMTINYHKWPQMTTNDHKWPKMPKMTKNAKKHSLTPPSSSDSSSTA